MAKIESGAIAKSMGEISEARMDAIATRVYAVLEVIWVAETDREKRMAQFFVIDDWDYCKGKMYPIADYEGNVSEWFYRRMRRHAKAGLPEQTAIVAAIIDQIIELEKEGNVPKDTAGKVVAAVLSNA